MLIIMEIADLTKQNPWWKDPKTIQDAREIRDYKKAKYPWEPRLRYFFKWNEDLIYTLRGPRQVGKTTLIKLLIKEWLDKGVAPGRVFYYTCDILTDKKELAQLLETYIGWVRSQHENRVFIFLDEISSVKDWQRSIKLLKDTGGLDNASIILTGSHAIDVKKSGEMLPGRRGKSGPLNKILVPMKFAEFLEVAKSNIPIPKSSGMRKSIVLSLFKGKIDTSIQALLPYLKDLDSYLDKYLITGGFPSSVTQLLENGTINHYLYELYTRAVVGDMCKWDKNDRIIREIFVRLIETMTTRVGWDTIRNGTSIRHHETVKEYVIALKDSFAIGIASKVDPNKKQPVPSHKKIYFSDPLIFHSIKSWVEGYSDPFRASKESLDDPELKSKLIESLIYNHLVRLAYNLQPSDLFDPEDFVFYWSDGKELDFAFKYEGKLFPVDVTYRKQIGTNWAWVKETFGYPIIISKETFKVRSDYASVPASIFLSLI